MTVAWLLKSIKELKLLMRLGRVRWQREWMREE